MEPSTGATIKGAKSVRKGARWATQPEKQTSLGKHGGNRAGSQAQNRRRRKRSSQAAGKDPKRAKEF